jgi:FkbM family methyltransferase
VGLIRHRLFGACARLVQIHPYIWKLAWEAVHRLPILLPHDPSYNAIRHFIAVKPHGLFLDIGANDGISALSFRKYSKDYRILSFEPNPLLEPYLHKIKARDPNFDYRIVAVGPRRGQATFFVPVYNSIVLHTFTSENRDHALGAVARSFGAAIAGKVRIETFDSEVVPLDELKLDPSIVKIDAEGFEHAILHGLHETLQRARPFVIVEIGIAECANIAGYFSRHKYALLAYDPWTARFHSSLAFKDQWGHRNFFAVPDEFLSSMPVKKAAGPRDL